MTEIIARVCKQVLSQNAGDNPKLADENKAPGTGRMKRTPQNSPCHKCNKLGHWARECPQKDLKKEETKGQHLNSKATPLGASRSSPDESPNKAKQNQNPSLLQF